jgi:hypothetical protein
MSYQINAKDTDGTSPDQDRESETDARFDPSTGPANADADSAGAF